MLSESHSAFNPADAGVGSRLSVTCVAGVAAVERFAADIDRLNALSSRRNPFLSSAFLRCYGLRAEYHTPGQEERLYLIRETDGRPGERIIGIAPLRRSLDEMVPSLGPVGLRGVRLRFLAPLDTERPGILAAPEDMTRVAAALIDHLCTRERDWGLLEFASQLPGSPLHEAVHAAANGTFRARDFPVEPYTEIAVVWADLDAYFRSLGKKMRSNISRQARRLFAQGRVEVVLAEGGQAAGEWFEAYCDLDSRSWKQGTQSSIHRSARRVRFYRDIAAGRGGLDPSFIGILLDGVLIAGLLVGSNSSAAPAEQGAWCLEMAYDQSRAALGPGQLLLLLAMGEAIRRGDRFLNFMQNFAYYKHRWGAAAIPVVNVQLLRRASLHNLRASIGEWRRRLAAARETGCDSAHADVAAEAAKRPEAGPGAGVIADDPSGGNQTPKYQSVKLMQPAVTFDLTRARELTEAALAYAGPGIRRLDREQAAVYMPFEID